MSAATEWPLRRLGEICEFKYGKSLPESARSGGEVPVYGSNGVVGGHDLPLTASETIVIGRKGSHGEVNFSDKPCWPIDTTYYVDSTATKANLHWLKYRLAGAGLNQMNRAAAVPGLNREDAYRVEILLPPLEEQRRIAAILDQAETLRTQRRQALAHLDTLTQSIFLHMFGDPVANPQRFEVVSLGDICDVRDGTHDSPKYVDEGYPLVTSKNLSSGQVDLSNVNFISAADYEAINRRSKVDRGDLLMPMIGTIGNPVLIDHEPRYAVKNVAIVKFPEGSPSNIFIRAILSGRYFDFVVAQKNRGGTQKFVSLGDLRSFPIPLPPPALQQTFATRIQAIEALKATHRTALAQLDALFASLQQRAFAGAL